MALGKIRHVLPHPVVVVGWLVGLHNILYLRIAKGEMTLAVFVGYHFSDPHYIAAVLGDKNIPTALFPLPGGRCGSR
jgi:hypothetical protein